MKEGFMKLLKLKIGEACTLTAVVESLGDFHEAQLLELDLAVRVDSLAELPEAFGHALLTEHRAAADNGVPGFTGRLPTSTCEIKLPPHVAQSLAVAVAEEAGERLMIADVVTWRSGERLYTGHVVGLDHRTVAVTFAEELREGGNVPHPNPILFVDRPLVRFVGRRA
jgi:hypothetical protein